MSRLKLPHLIEALENLAQTRPNECALTDDRGDIAWLELATRVERCAEELGACGLSPGERVGIHGFNSIELASTVLACWRAGLVTVLLTPTSKGPELELEMRESGASAYIGDPDLYPVGQPVLEHCPTLRLGLLLNRGAMVPEIEVKLPGVTSFRLKEPPPADLAAILFSSGTTGVPKGVMHTHRTLACMGQPLEGLQEMPQKILAVTPISYITSLFVLAQCLCNGDRAVLLRHFNPEVLLDTFALHRCTYMFTLPPSGCQLLLTAQRAHPRDTSSAILWPVGGDAFPRSLLDAWPRCFGLPLSEGYALTEFFPALCNRIGRNRPGSIGEPWGNVEAGIFSESGNQCAVDELGEIRLRGPAMCAGYWNDPKTTAAVIRKGWFHTGDLGSRDADGYYHFRGRIKQIIACDGEKISPLHVENALLEHPDVIEAGVVGKPDKLRGEIPAAFVRLRPGSETSATELQEFVRVRVEDCAVPEIIEFLEVLPRGRTGKVDRRRLKELIATKTSAEG